MWDSTFLLVEKSTNSIVLFLKLLKAGILRNINNSKNTLINLILRIIIEFKNKTEHLVVSLRTLSGSIRSKKMHGLN